MSDILLNLLKIVGLCPTVRLSLLELVAAYCCIVFLNLNRVRDAREVFSIEGPAKRRIGEHKIHPSDVINMFLRLCTLIGTILLGYFGINRINETFLRQQILEKVQIFPVRLLYSSQTSNVE